MTPLAASTDYCRGVCRRSGSSFRFAFGVLPAEQRQAMEALYAFCRLSDDLGDDGAATDAEQRLRTLGEWRDQLNAALAGTFTHPCHPALTWAVSRFAIPPRYLHDILDGIESDLRGLKIATADDLRGYCYRVASAVGLACLRIWGLRDGATWKAAEPLAVEAGYAFQLTNILRDLGEDSRNGRVYLPADDFERFGVSALTWQQETERGKVEPFLRFQIDRANGFYAASAGLGEMLRPPGLVMHGLLVRAYLGLLARIEADPRAVFTRRVRLGRWEKAKLLLAALAARLRSK